MASLHDFAQLHMAFSNQSHANVSSGSIRLPLTVLDTLVPGSSHLATFLLGFGLDISLFVSWSAILATVWAALRFGLIPAYQFIVKALSSSVIVEEYDPIYNHVLNWASAQKYLQDIRSLRAHTAGQYYDDLEDYGEDDNHQMRIREGMSEDTIFNFNNWSARAPPTFRPHSSSGWFFHNCRLFRLYRSRDRVASDFTGAVYERERLEISVIWLSPKPIKSMIQEAREFHLIRRTSTTTIKRPTPKSQRSGRGQAWTTIANRPSRSMATVVLDNDQKAAILKDFNDFLHPRTARWYSNRGIPYRRGYLFHGPPGTGKTSLSFALAGVFGLDIYCLALSEATLTEEDLVLLFNSLPKRCILLLEDIDSAGLGRAPGAKDAEKRETTNQSPSSKGTQRKKKSLEDEDAKDKSAGVPPPTVVGQPNAFGKEPTFKNTLTFSGLLNAIDGVASQEGRVLIMTTNHLERLDEALTRPGRIDLTIKFDLATKQQIKDLFLRMYCVDSIEMTRQPARISQILPSRPETEVPGAPTFKSGDVESSHVGHLGNNNDPKPRLSPGESFDGSSVVDLAERFADSLPERALSPAEIQGFLLVRKKCPGQAVADVVKWRDEKMPKKCETTKAKKNLRQAREYANGSITVSEGENMEAPSSFNDSALSNEQKKLEGMASGLSGVLASGEDAIRHAEPTWSTTVEPDAAVARAGIGDQAEREDEDDGTQAHRTAAASSGRQVKPAEHGASDAGSLTSSGPDENRNDIESDSGDDNANELGHGATAEDGDVDDAEYDHGDHDGDSTSAGDNDRLSARHHHHRQHWAFLRTSTGSGRGGGAGRLGGSNEYAGVEGDGDGDDHCECGCDYECDYL
ncbi:uncharacterized protein Z519_06412 [Cladophialophora bantiana CBS 173.52]|uniref:AAA+ ATPase domain-containing protein n=1 Tax=Cladophialophora bantiana (strain ATCC 10958 / CBS 173.52 / CDC B-1940 / NIH 8579) TaxID=1442370 RepID=A0A0D2HP27_CLAB1|nr:uncharacterized protein Z519_06412 [Cladophialophora bantiana CBS 173.52]KIW92565.1 hypothetical protein Z519_06412 [Cladophialophora bantiana CBS 173.52]